MRTLLFSLVVALVGLFSASSSNASATSVVGKTAVETTTVAVAALVAIADNEEHCAHVPCANGAHSHSSCSTHSFVVIGEGGTSLNFNATASIASKADRFGGRTLLPPVPPPLA